MKLIGSIQKQDQTQINRCVSYNYAENCWTTSSLARSSYSDQGVFDLPYATDYNSTATPNFPTILGITSKYGASTYYAQETGTDQINSSQVPLPLMLIFNRVILILRIPIILLTYKEMVILLCQLNDLFLTLKY
jgi:hypothetical protein